jgi:hypothetical protein
MQAIFSCSFQILDELEIMFYNHVRNSIYREDGYV